MPRDRVPPEARCDAPATGRAGGTPRVALREQATRALEAIRLTELGARAGLVSRLTGLEKAAANRLYREVHGTPSPAGQLPFTDAWYLEDERRMLHASLVWRLHGALAKPDRGLAQALIDVYECYSCLVHAPLLDLTRAVYVPRLVAMGTWHQRRCVHCEGAYLAPPELRAGACPGCRLYHRYRCPGCGNPLAVPARGGRRRVCACCADSNAR